MKLALQAAGFAVLLMLTFCLWQTQRLILQFQESVVRLESTAAITIETENLSTLKTQTQLRKTLAAAERTTTTLPKILDERIATTARLLDARVETTTATLDGRLGSAVALANVQLTATNQTLKAEADNLAAQMSAANASIASVARPAGSLAAQMDSAAPLYLDCEHNPSCLFNEYVGFRHDFNRFTKSVTDATVKYTAPKTKAQKVEGVLDGLFWAAVAAWSHGVL